MSAGSSDFLLSSGFSRFFFASCTFTAEMGTWSKNTDKLTLPDTLILGALLVVPFVFPWFPWFSAPSSSVSGSEILKNVLISQDFSVINKTFELPQCHPTPLNIDLITSLEGGELSPVMSFNSSDIWDSHSPCVKEGDIVQHLGHLLNIGVSSSWKMEGLIKISEIWFWI